MRARRSLRRVRRSSPALVDARAGSTDARRIAAARANGRVRLTTSMDRRAATPAELRGGWPVRVGLLTGGGDCPGLNAVIRAVVRKGERDYGDELVGFRDGWKGPIEGLTMPLNVERCRGILPRGGTILGSSRTNPYKVDGGVENVKKT